MKNETKNKTHQYLNVEILSSVKYQAKVRAAILRMTLDEYITQLICKDTKRVMMPK